MSGYDSNHPAPAPESAAAVILAAGASTRMGCVKQLLTFGAETLLSRAITQARKANFDRIVVVLGAHSDQIAPFLGDSQAEAILNPQWEAGMGSSIHAGLTYLREKGPEPDAMAILLVDQPHVTAYHLLAMRRLFRDTQAAIVAARYDGRLGVPALFRREVFPQLASLPPSSGARQLLRYSGIAEEPFPLPEAAIDIDTPADLAAVPGMRL
jgi:CTP:molybdopterin cytidylyltransferase MocA